MTVPFRPTELGGPDGVGSTPLEQADLLVTARELEWIAGTVAATPSEGFVDRVVAAISTEPLPLPTAAARRAARGRRFGALALAIADTWRTAWAGGSPLAVRARAVPLVLVVVLLVGGAGGLVAAGAFGLLGPSSPTPAVGSPPPSPLPSPLPPAPTPSEGPTKVVEPSPRSPEPSEGLGPAESPHPGDSQPSDDGHAGPTPRPTATPHGTPKATETPEPTDTPEPTETPEPSDDDHGSGHGSGSGSGG